MGIYVTKTEDTWDHEELQQFSEPEEIPIGKQDGEGRDASVKKSKLLRLGRWTLYNQKYDFSVCREDHQETEF